MASAFYSAPPMPHAFVEPQPSLSHNPAFYSQPNLNPALFVQPAYDTSNVSSPRLKRKRSSSGSGDESDDRSVRASTHSRSPTPPSATAPTPRHKKRRLGTIERGLEHMSLQREQLPHLSLSSAMQTAVFASEPIVEEPDDVDLTSHSYSYYGDIDEYPSTPPMREVKMRGTSWFEPEKDRIVITDLDGSDDDETDAEGPAEAHGEGTLHISPAMLSALRRSRSSFRVPMPNTPSSEGDAAALVLYRPSPWRRTPSAFPGEPDIEVLEDDYESGPRIGSVGGDTMDVDMMDVEEL